MSEETNKGSNRTPREASSQSTKAARKPWTPPQVLETPDAPPGMKYRWIRTHVRGEDDRTNVHMRFREGFEPVKPEEVQGYDLPTIDDGKHAGTVGVGGLISRSLHRHSRRHLHRRHACCPQPTWCLPHGIRTNSCVINAQGDWLSGRRGRQQLKLPS